MSTDSQSEIGLRGQTTSILYHYRRNPLDLARAPALLILVPGSMILVMHGFCNTLSLDARSSRPKSRRTESCSGGPGYFSWARRTWRISKSWAGMIPVIASTLSPRQTSDFLESLNYYTRLYVVFDGAYMNPQGRRLSDLPMWDPSDLSEEELTLMRLMGHQIDFDGYSKVIQNRRNPLDLAWAPALLILVPDTRPCQCKASLIHCHWTQGP
ncbi:unnamed protein product [Bursaphelenchus xylophilus]|uniref:(pine wood nematode) hypothetical protein n=1 Tax=Bursaphelenchus xylophilus TaxID=6326 RepID=A0A1I7RJW1_BURXY|nr:unnamed protein product [Bursaphelenchus xylophilus]CAG9129104.1 unnamed protein product [Bursaphelenchus xylophilus]